MGDVTPRTAEQQLARIFSTEYIVDSPMSGIVAAAGGGQNAATLITGKQVNKITTVATAGDSVALPPSVPGLVMYVVNSASNPMQVYGSGTDTINGIASATGASQPANSFETYVCADAGLWHCEIGTGYSGSMFTESSKDNITAFAGGGKASATLITAQTSRVATVATVGDSILLPVSAPGLEILVINHGANEMQVFGNGTDTVDDVATATGVAQMANSLVIYTAASAGAWYSEGLSTGFAGPGLQSQSYANGLTALGTTQGTALQLARMINRITTAAAGTGVLLPAAVAGLVITVVHRGANPINVYGNGTDTVNGVASVSAQINSVAVFTCTLTGVWETDAVGQGFAGNLPTVSSTNGITAFAGGGQGSAVVLATVINRVTTVATAADSVKLPAAIAGLVLTVYNAAAANSLNVFPGVGDIINALGANAAFALPAGKNSSFGSAVNGQWHAILSA